MSTLAQAKTDNSLLIDKDRVQEKHPGKRFFHGFNELRALAALSVIIAHVEYFKYKQKWGSLLDDPFWYKPVIELGTNGVHLFFTLSGFLITYLLLEERQNRGSIQMRKFYVRRILRIWPLYYLVLGLSFVGLPLFGMAFPDAAKHLQSSYQHIYSPFAGGTPWLATFMYVFMLPNFAINLEGGMGVVTGAGQGWSIGVEEQFYLFWPAVASLSYRTMFFTLVGLASFCIAYHPLKEALELQKYLPDWLIFTLNFGLYFQYMCMGALVALGLIRKNALLQAVLAWRLLPWLLVSVIGVLVITGTYMVLLGACFALLVGMMAERPGIFRVPILDHLGQISYGIYMYHMLIMYLIGTAIAELKIPILYITPLFYLASCVLVYTIARTSYKYFELPFLRMKAKFE